MTMSMTFFVLLSVVVVRCLSPSSTMQCYASRPMDDDHRQEADGYATPSPRERVLEPCSIREAGKKELSMDQKEKGLSCTRSKQRLLNIRRQKGRLKVRGASLSRRFPVQPNSKVAFVDLIPSIQIHTLRDFHDILPAIYHIDLYPPDVFPAFGPLQVPRAHDPDPDHQPHPRRVSRFLVASDAESEVAQSERDDDGLGWDDPVIESQSESAVPPRRIWRAQGTRTPSVTRSLSFHHFEDRSERFDRALSTPGRRQPGTIFSHPGPAELSSAHSFERELNSDSGWSVSDASHGEPTVTQPAAASQFYTSIPEDDVTQSDQFPHPAVSRSGISHALRFENLTLIQRSYLQIRLSVLGQVETDHQDRTRHDASHPPDPDTHPTTVPRSPAEVGRTQCRLPKEEPTVDPNPSYTHVACILCQCSRALRPADASWYTTNNYEFWCGTLLNTHCGVAYSTATPRFRKPGRPPRAPRTVRFASPTRPSGRSTSPPPRLRRTYSKSPQRSSLDRLAEASVKSVQLMERFLEKQKGEKTVDHTKQMSFSSSKPPRFVDGFCHKGDLESLDKQDRFMHKLKLYVEQTLYVDGADLWRIFRRELHTFSNKWNRARRDGSEMPLPTFATTFDGFSTSWQVYLRQMVPRVMENVPDTYETRVRAMQPQNAFAEIIALVSLLYEVTDVVRHDDFEVIRKELAHPKFSKPGDALLDQVTTWQRQIRVARTKGNMDHTEVVGSFTWIKILQNHIEPSQIQKFYDAYEHFALDSVDPTLHNVRSMLKNAIALAGRDRSNRTPSTVKKNKDDVPSPDKPTDELSVRERKRAKQTGKPCPREASDGYCGLAQRGRCFFTHKVTKNIVSPDASRPPPVRPPVRPPPGLQPPVGKGHPNSTDKGKAKHSPPSPGDSRPTQAQNEDDTGINATGYERL